MANCKTLSTRMPNKVHKYCIFDKLCLVVEAPEIVKGLFVHSVIISFGLLVTAAIAIWNVVVGEQLRGLTMHSTM